jgi:hypothetical protein
VRIPKHKHARINICGIETYSQRSIHPSVLGPPSLPLSTPQPPTQNPPHLDALREGDHLLRDRDLAPVGERELRGARRVERGLEGERLLRVLRQRLERRDGRRVVRLERLAHESAVGLHRDDVLVARLGLDLARDEVDLGRLGVHLEVLRGAVRVPDALDPALRHEDLRVPAVAGLVRHLRLEVLAEAEALGLDARALEEERRARHEVRERLVVDDARRDGLADRRGDHLAVPDLVVRGEEVEAEVLDGGELCVRLGLRVDEVLNLRHRELAHADEAAARGDLVALGGADLRDGHRHAAVVVVVEAAEVDEHALRRLGAEEARELPRRPDRRLEHEVEGEGGREVVARRGRLDAELREDAVERGGLVRVRLRRDLAELLAALRAERLVRLDEVLDEVLEELVRALALARLRVLHHEVLELVDVARGLEDGLGRERRALDLEHRVLEDEVLAPEREEVVLERRARRALVLEARDAAVDLKGGDDEHAAEERLVERALVHAPLVERAARLLRGRRRLVELLAERLERLDGRLDVRLPSGGGGWTVERGSGWGGWGGGVGWVGAGMSGLDDHFRRTESKHIQQKRRSWPMF